MTMRRIWIGIGCLGMLLATGNAVWAGDSCRGCRRGGESRIHEEMHIQDRVGRAFTSHHMLGARFTAPGSVANQHLHTTRTGRVIWHSEVPGESRFSRRHRHGEHNDFVAPPSVVVTTPFFCDPCAVGFASPALFQGHVRAMHGVPADQIDGWLTDVDGRLVFVGE
jgi:hypothetical protein